MKSFQRKGFGGMLLAIVMIDSFDRKFADGFVDLISKTTGVQQFYQHLGARLISSSHLYFDNEASQKVIDQYLPEGGVIDGY
ncbi:hypothetical protein [Lentilactobacillus kisonensis]|uniref:hypothetical protein n=1 Tax=Lentilactobacillus kisonensis TaxID=481722 RepID=UPI0006D004AC|nr:hypothetical protein [Lentilactobacillus kisonensis]